MVDDKILKGDFPLRLNMGIESGWAILYENDEMMLLRTDTVVAGVRTVEYHVIMKDQDSEQR